MFGYIKTAKPELKIKEYEVYKAVYCSLCRRLGKNYGIFSRLTLSYDFTFLALLQLSLQEGCDSFEQKRCAFQPLKKCNYCKNDSALAFPAAAAMIMLYYQLLDHLQDEHGLKRLGYWLIKPVFSSAHRKAAKDYPQIEAVVAAYIKKQNELESRGCKNIDEAADPTGQALAGVLRLCSEDKDQQRVLERLGYCLGRYIYLLDAACDLPQDLKNGSYNVLSYALHGQDAKAYAEKRIEPQLYTCMNEAGRALELLNIKKYKPILDNIIYFGLEETFKKEFAK
ncbi:MAG: hypothetical protein IKI29_00980 [Clostridia bacterium]|nr:hypothetical protein [Clostridia bacterium]